MGGAGERWRREMQERGEGGRCTREVEGRGAEERWRRELQERGGGGRGRCGKDVEERAAGEMWRRAHCLCFVHLVLNARLEN